MKEQTVKELVKVVRESTESINALDYGRYDENAHTELLAAILRHRKGLFVKSFLVEMLMRFLSMVLVRGARWNPLDLYMSQVRFDINLRRHQGILLS